MKLNALKPKKGSVFKKTIVGRGIGSGKGKTCGRGVKGQKARSGVALKGFEGGQMPLYRRMPKRGFNNIFAGEFVTVTLGALQQAVDAKRLDAKAEVTEDAMVKAGVLRRKRDGVRLVSGGELKAGLKLVVRGGVTKTAEAAVKKAGGSVEVVKFTPAPVKPRGQGKKKEGKKPAKKK